MTVDPFSPFTALVLLCFTDNLMLQCYIYSRSYSSVCYPNQFDRIDTPNQQVFHWSSNRNKTDTNDSPRWSYLFCHVPPLSLVLRDTVIAAGSNPYPQRQRLGCSSPSRSGGRTWNMRKDLLHTYNHKCRSPDTQPAGLAQHPGHDS